jgi:peroxiredoxin
LAVSIDQGLDEKVRTLVKDFVQRHNLTFLNLLDSKSEFAAQFGVRGVPINFFINPRGKVIAYASGYRDWQSEDGRKVIEELISQTNG